MKRYMTGKKTAVWDLSRFVFLLGAATSGGKKSLRTDSSKPGTFFIWACFNVEQYFILPVEGNVVAPMVYGMLFMCFSFFFNSPLPPVLESV